MLVFSSGADARCGRRLASAASLADLRAAFNASSGSGKSEVIFNNSLAASAKDESGLAANGE